MIKNLPANAGDPGLIPAPEDPTYPGATKPMHHNHRTPRTLEPVLHHGKSLQWEAHALQLERTPYSSQLEEACT